MSEEEKGQQQNSFEIAKPRVFVVDFDMIKDVSDVVEVLKALDVKFSYCHEAPETIKSLHEKGLLKETTVE